MSSAARPSRVRRISCFDYMLSHAGEELTENMIKEFHRLLKRNTSDERKEWFRVGDYKSRANVVGGKETAVPAEVAGKMHKLLAGYHAKDSITVQDIIEFHYNFESIHPFQDGNGRVGRIIMFKEYLGHDVMPFIIDEKHKLFYYRGLKEYKSEKGYLTDTCLSAQDQYTAMAAYFFPELT